MDEKLQELLNAVQKTAIDLGEGAVNAAYFAGKKVEDLAAVSKCRAKLQERKTQLATALREVGDLIYSTHRGEPTDSDILLDKLSAIDALQAEIASLCEQLAQLRGDTRCPVCAAARQKGDRFCRDCGAKF